MTGRVLIVGTGLIGTSAALALQSAGADVALSDRDSRRLELAISLGAGRPRDPAERYGVALICVPPDAVAATLSGLQQEGAADFYSDAASIKTKPLAEVEAIGADLTSFVGGHPVAGRERAGAQAARADLFYGRPWVLTPSATATEQALEAIRRLVLSCGAVPVVTTPERHDAAMALVSHAPQLVASALAAQLGHAPDETLFLAGPGLADTTRLADSDPQLWGQIAAGNAGPLAEIVESIAAELTAAADALRAGSAAHSVADLVARGRAGRNRLPGKHGSATGRGFAVVPVVLADRPGELARLFADVGAAGVNIEDIRIEHSPAHPVGVAELAVAPSAAGQLVESLREHGWPVHPESDSTGK